MRDKKNLFQRFSYPILVCGSFLLKIYQMSQTSLKKALNNFFRYLQILNGFGHKEKRELRHFFDYYFAYISIFPEIYTSFFYSQALLQ